MRYNNLSSKDKKAFDNRVKRIVSEYSPRYPEQAFASVITAARENGIDTVHSVIRSVRKHRPEIF